jgi:hypothetical protein
LVSTQDAVDWLLSSDPAIRWQALRDLTDRSPDDIVAERVRVAHEGIGAEILACQEIDGAWRRPDAPTTICVLEGLLEYERAVGAEHAKVGEIAAARHRGEGYLLERDLFRRLSTGEIASAEFLEIAFPPRYHYDVLRALDYLRAAGHSPAEPRVRDAIRILKSNRQSDGRWLLDRAYEEAITISTGESVGQPSRWNTLRALRVLRWFEEFKG